MRKGMLLVLSLVVTTLGIYAMLPAKEAAGKESIASDEFECPIVYANVDTVFREKDSGRLTLSSEYNRYQTGTVYVTGSNWWDYNDEWGEARGIAIFDLKDFNLPEDSKAILGLGDAGGKGCDDPSDCGSSPPTPNAISISSFVANGKEVVVADWAASAKRITVLTTDAGQHIPISEPYYYVDVTEAVEEFLENVEKDKRYMGLRFEPTKASDFEDLSMYRGDGLGYGLQLQVIADPEGFVKTALDIEEGQDPTGNVVNTNQGQIEYSGPEIRMSFTPHCGPPLPLKALAAALNVDHFNWEQTREEPSNWSRYIADHIEETAEKNRAYTNINMTCRRHGPWETNSITYAYGPFAGQNVDLVPVTGPVYDPFVSNPAGPDKIEVLGIDGPEENDLCWVILPYWKGDGGKEAYFARDAFTPYWNIPDEVALHTTEYSLNFRDKPILPSWALTYNSPSVNQFWRFSTSLVGVKDGKVVIRSNPVHWKSNGTVVIDTSSQDAKAAVGQASLIPYLLEYTETSGGIFDVEVPESTGTPPPDYALHLPMIIGQ